MQKGKRKSFDFKKLPYQDDLTDESKARVKMLRNLSKSLFTLYYVCILKKDDGMTDGMTEAMMEEMMELNDDDFI